MAGEPAGGSGGGQEQALPRVAAKSAERGRCGRPCGRDGSAGGARRGGRVLCRACRQLRGRAGSVARCHGDRTGRSRSWWDVTGALEDSAGRAGPLSGPALRWAGGRPFRVAAAVARGYQRSGHAGRSRPEMCRTELEAAARLLRKWGEDSQ